MVIEEVTTIDLSEPIQVARGSVVTDESGTRQATLMFPQSAKASMVLPDGTVAAESVMTLADVPAEMLVGVNLDALGWRID